MESEAKMRIAQLRKSCMKYADAGRSNSRQQGK